jgi:hypothetical protein
MLTLNAKNLTLNEVHHFLKLDKLPSGSFNAFLSLESVTEIEQRELQAIWLDFDTYLSDGRVSEGVVKLLTLAPLLRLANFYGAPIKLTTEDSLNIATEDEGTTITGRMDILAVNQEIQNLHKFAFWILVIEAKNSTLEVREGLPQLLAYAYTSLEQQPFVWGLVTNGLRYQFAHLKQGNPPTYQLMPELNLFESDRAMQLLQVLKAICKLQSSYTPAVTLA